MVCAPRTFDTKFDAASWLQAHASAQLPAEPERFTVTEYGEELLRTRMLKPRTRLEYRRVFDSKIVPTLGAVGLHRLSPASVRARYATLDPAHPTRRAHAYSLLRTICNAAVADDLISTNPCRIRSAGNARAVREVTIATLPALEVIVTAMPERLRSMVPLAGWCELRFGELAGLTRTDLDLEAGTVSVRRAVVRLPGEFVVGIRNPRPAGVPWPSRRTRSTSCAGTSTTTCSSLATRRCSAATTPATAATSRSTPSTTPSGRRVTPPGARTCTSHDLRHTGATLAAAPGATLADLMARIGHSTPAIALRYQHAVEGRDQQIAAALSALRPGQGHRPQRPPHHRLTATYRESPHDHGHARSWYSTCHVQVW